jgi:hypothetical protein
MLPPAPPSERPRDIRAERPASPLVAEKAAPPRRRAAARGAGWVRSSQAALGSAVLRPVKSLRSETPRLPTVSVMAAASAAAHTAAHKGNGE